MLDTILFDLDGTLMPFDQQEFINEYFSRLCKRLVPMGYTPDAVVKAVWKGTGAMMQNDGSCLNHVRFWDTFAALLGEDARQTESVCDAFYGEEFDEVKCVLRGATPAASIVSGLKQKGYTVVLATNPLFPPVAVRTRLAWVGLTPEDFAHVTHYQNSTACKPNPLYFEEILRAIGKRPENCLMAGNNAAEDLAAADVGMDVYLVTDFLESDGTPLPETVKKGTLADFAAFCEALPAITK